MAEKAVPYPKAGNESDSSSVSSTETGNDGNLDTGWCESIHDKFSIAKGLFQAGLEVPIPKIDSSKQLSLLSGKSKEAQEVINSISHYAAGGTWKMGEYVAKILTSAITNKGGFSLGSYVHSLPLEKDMVVKLNSIKEQILFMQEVRVAAITAHAYHKLGRLDDEAYGAFKMNISVSVLARLRSDGSVLIPVDFIPKSLHDTEMNGEKKKKASSHASLALLNSNSKNDDVSVSFFETTGRYTDAWVNANDVAPKVTATTLREDIEYLPSPKALKNLALVQNVSSGRDPISGRMEKIFSMTQSKSEFKDKELADLESVEEKNLLHNISSWINVRVSGDPQKYEQDIYGFSKSLNLGPLQRQRLQAIQEHGVCELKSIYSYLMHQHPGFPFEYIRTAIITDAHEKLKALSAKGGENGDEELISALISLTDTKAKDPNLGDVSQTTIPSVEIEKLLSDAAQKRDQAELRLRIFAE